MFSYTYHAFASGNAELVASLINLSNLFPWSFPLYTNIRTTGGHESSASLLDRVQQTGTHESAEWHFSRSFLLHSCFACLDADEDSQMLGVGRLDDASYFGEYTIPGMQFDYLTFVLGGIYWRMFRMVEIGGCRE